MTFLTFVYPSTGPRAVQAQFSCSVIICPNSVQKLQLWSIKISNNRNRCLEILDAAKASSNYAPKGRFVNGDLSFLYIMFSWLSRIIVDIVTSSSFQTRAKVWTANKNSIFHKSGSFSRLCKHANLMVLLDKLKGGKEGNQIASVLATLHIAEISSEIFSRPNRK